MRRPKKLDPTTLWVITDSTKPITPTFSREELVRAALNEPVIVREGEGLS